MEVQYQKYVAGKGREGLVPRVREEWKVAVDYWSSEHPTARGNRFNEKRRGVYAFDEVAVVNPKNVAAGERVAGDLRVDSYDIHPTDPTKNKIISRKATDLDAVEEAAIVHDLDELRQKYPPGALITSWKEAPGLKLRGQKLQGELYLELPSSNLRPEVTPLRTHYEALAKSKGITIIYADE